MNKLVNISLSALAMIASACFSACADYEEMIASIEDANASHMTLRVNAPSRSTTYTPKGGEDGDGRENGVNHEDEIKNVTVFFFRTNDGFDAAATTPFVLSRYFNENGTGYKWVETAEGVQISYTLDDSYTPEDNDRVIVIANAGDLTEKIYTLGELRNYRNYSAWKEGSTIVDANTFVMSSAYNNSTDGYVHVSNHEGSTGDPYIANMNVQRAAARIDFMYNEDDNLTGTAPYSEFSYAVREDPEDETSAQIATAHLLNIVPMNMMKEPSYLIKRVTTDNDITSAVKYGALETVDADKIPTNYVIEPHTLLKQGDVQATTLNSWYTLPAATAFAAPETYMNQDTDISHYMVSNTECTELDYFDNYMTLAYTNENTQSKERQTQDFISGLLLKVIYEPQKVYTDKDLTPYPNMEEYATGKTFWRYSPTKDEMAEKDCLYFASEQAALDYQTAHPEDLAHIDKYTNGICYYNIWLRHANSDADPKVEYPMEYGIVRNNIYRVGIRFFTGPGSIVPDDNEPTHLYLRIFVRKWNLRVQPEIRL